MKYRIAPYRTKGYTIHFVEITDSNLSNTDFNMQEESILEALISKHDPKHRLVSIRLNHFQTYSESSVDYVLGNVVSINFGELNWVDDEI